MPAQPVAGQAGLSHCFHKCATILLESPVVAVTVKNKILQPSREKMLRYQSRARAMIHEHAREFKFWPPETKIDCRLFCLQHKLRKIIAGAKPCENAVTFPTPGNNSF